LLGARTVSMKPAGDGCFAGAGFALDQDGSEVGFDAAIGGDDLFDLRLQVGEGGPEEELVVRIFFAAMLLDAEVLLRAARAIDEDGQFRKLERFGEIFERAHLERFNCAADAALGGHDDDTGVLLKNAIAQEIGAEAVGEIYIDDGEIEREVADDLAGLLDAVDGGDIGAEAFEVRGDLFTEQRVVLQDEHT